MTLTNETTIRPGRFETINQPLIITGLQEEYLFGSDMDISSEWDRFYPRLSSISERIGEVSYGVSSDLESGEGIAYLSGVEVSEAKALPTELDHRELSPHTYAVFVHSDHVSTIRRTIQTVMHEWLPNVTGNLPEEADFWFERYGDDFDPETGTGGIEIWIPVNSAN